MKTILRIIPFLIAVLLSATEATAQTFVENTSHGLYQILSGSIDWGDYDNDGDLDVLMSGYNPAGLISKVYTNNGNGTFTEQTTMPLLGLKLTCVKWFDYDGDGYVDIFITGENVNCQDKAIIYRNNGDGTITYQPTMVMQGVVESGVDWGDYDNDGDPDIALTGYSYYVYYAQVYRNNGNHTLTLQSGVPLSGIYKSCVTWIDYDKDGDLDLALVGSAYSNYAAIIRNNGNSTFTNVGQIDPGNSGSLHWADYDGDGYPDVVATGYYDTRVYKNNGNGTMTLQSTLGLPGVSNGEATWGDYDNDGDPDLLICGKHATLGQISRVYTNNGNNSFTQLTGLPLMPLKYSLAHWVDYDNDGDLDIVLSGMDSVSGCQTRVYNNTLNTPNPAPSVPTGLSAQHVGSRFLFTWNRSTDNNTPQQSITYNIRVGSTPNGIDIRAPQSDLTTGFHRVLRAGEMRDTFAYIEIPPGQYQQGVYTYWSVQAIDNGYKASPFAAYDSITPSFFINASADTAITLGTSVQISANPNMAVAATYQWAPATGLSSTTISSPIATPSATTTYHVTVTYGSQLFTDSVKVSVNHFKELSGLNLQGVKQGDCDWVDYDKDGDLDIMMTGNDGTNKKTLFYRNMGGGNFIQDTITGLPNIDFSATAWADFDLDGDLDLVLCGYGQSLYTSGLYINNGNKTFTLKSTTSLPGIFEGFVQWVDYDRDGDPDLLLSETGLTRIYRNEGGNLVYQSSISLPGLPNPSCDWADYDGDGDPDLLLAGNGIARVYENLGNNSFAEQTAIPLTGLNHPVTGWGDCDNDGDIDILLSGDSAFLFRCFVYLNQGYNNFVKTPIQGLPEYFKSSSGWGDYDNDGDLDLVFTGDSGAGGQVIKVYRHTANGNYQPDDNILLKALNSGSIHWGDYDNDKDLDLLITGSDSTGCFSKVFENRRQFIDLNTAPTTPTGLAMNFTGDSFVFRWNKASDNSTHPNSLSYNLSVGTTQNPSALVSPHSLTDGRRMLPEYGNAHTDTFALFRLASLSCDTVYYARLQAIDHSFIASPFSPLFPFTPGPKGLLEATADTILCGDSTLLTFSLFNGNPALSYYQWSPTAWILSSSAQQAWVRPLETTWFYLTVMSPFGQTLHDSILIQVKQQITAGFYAPEKNFSNPPFDVTFWNLTPDRHLYDFLWNFGDGSVLASGDSAVYHTYQHTGVYSVSLQVTHKVSLCSKTLLVPDYINCSAVGMEPVEPTALTMSIFPNPNSGLFTLRISDPTPGRSILRVIDLTGRICMEQELNSNEMVAEHKLILNSLKSGVYFLTVISERSAATEKLVVE